MTRTHARVRVAVLASTLLLQACSLISTRGPTPSPYTAPTQDPMCTTDRLPPIVDAAIAGLAVIGAIGMAATPAEPAAEGGSAGTIAAGAVMAVGFGASSGLGFYRTSQCDAAQRLWASERSKRDALEQAAEAAQRSQPLDRANLTVSNGHTDLLVTVTAFIPETKEEFVVLREHRIPTAETQTVGEVLKGRAGKKIVFTSRVMSLGEWREAGSVSTQFVAGGTLTLAFDWDPARAEFRTRGGWSATTP